MLVLVLVAAALVAASSAWPSENFKPTEAYLQEIFKPTEYLQGERTNFSLHAWHVVRFTFMTKRDGLQRQ